MGRKGPLQKNCVVHKLLEAEMWCAPPNPIAGHPDGVKYLHLFLGRYK